MERPRGILLAIWLALAWLGSGSVHADESDRPPAPSAPGLPTAAGELPPSPIAHDVPAAAPTPTTSLTAEPPSSGDLPAASEPAAAPALNLASPLPATDLWDRIRRRFRMPDLDTAQVRERERWYLDRPDYIARMVGRSNRYLFHIVEELERRDMPSELALLPFIESAFNPQAVSSAKAAGMWQFIPSTGKFFDLKQNAFRDDRRDVLASTRAALDYLQKLHAMFDDWQLALAAYNWGEGSVGRAIEKNRRVSLGTGYLDLRMPAETRLYLPKLQALKNIVANPQAFGAGLPGIDNSPFFQSVEITRDIDLALAARLAEVSVEDFRSLNPSLQRPVIFASGIPQILLPRDNAALFQRNLSAHGSAQLASWTAWHLPSTMKPAEAARRAGMSEAQLRAVNQIPNGVSIKAGSTLVVPRSSRTNADVSVEVADNGQLDLVRASSARRSVVRAAKGDTLASIARRHGLAASSLAQWNRLAVNANLATGQKIVLFLPSRSSQARAAAPTTARPPTPKLSTKLAGASLR